MRFIILGFLLVITSHAQDVGKTTENHLEFTIEKTWNGQTTGPEESIKLTLKDVPNSKDVKINVYSPYYNDPAPNSKAGEPFKSLWKYEVVEAYFLNDENHYLQIQLAPNGQHMMILFNETRSAILCCLPLQYSTEMEGSHWKGSVLIPGEYFPPQITKFNAAAMHGVGSKRRYLQLYPSDTSVVEPDFHILSTFQPISMPQLSKSVDMTSPSILWESALRGEVPFTISKTWDGKDIPKNEQVNITLKKADDNLGLLVMIESPFYNNTPPNAPPGERYITMWRHETVEVFFLNDDEQYLQVLVSPQGNYMSLIFNGRYNYINDTLPLDVKATINGSSWSSTLYIPTEYFPPKVTKFSAASQYNISNERRFLTLTPSTTNPTAPDFHNLAFYQSFDLNSTLENDEETLSPLWNEALRREFEYRIEFTWSKNNEVDDKSSVITLHPYPNSKDILAKIEAPYYNDTSPTDNPGLDIYKYEDVELYMANQDVHDQDGQYLQIMIHPQGYYMVYFFNGERNMIRHSLPLNVSTEIKGSTWTAEFIIPFEYLPAQVSRVNAGAMHGTAENRHFNTMSLCRDEAVPDFHSLRTFKSIRLDHLSPVFAHVPLSSIWDHALKREYHFTIQSSWNGAPVLPSEEVKITLKKNDITKDVLVKMESLFYDDPPLIGTPIGQLHEHEEMEVHFLNENEYYLQIMFSPQGQYLVLFFNGRRNMINRGLPLNVTTKVEGTKWTVETVVPADYFPPEVRKFSAAAMHGQGAERTYLTLSPNPNASTPDFHDLEHFQPLDMRAAPKWNLEDDKHFSKLWTTSLLGEFPYTIEKTWDDRTILDKEKVTLTLKGKKTSADLILKISAPYYNDPAPVVQPGPYWGLWNHEEVEAFFLNDANQYLQLIIGPHGHYLVLLQDGQLNAIYWSLPLNVTTSIEGSHWSSEVTIPSDYLPPQVTKFNAFSMHGHGRERRFLALYPSDGTLATPNFHDLTFFRPIDMGIFNRFYENDTQYSAIWTSALNSL